MGGFWEKMLAHVATHGYGFLMAFLWLSALVANVLGNGSAGLSAYSAILIVSIMVVPGEIEWKEAIGAAKQVIGLGPFGMADLAFERISFFAFSFLVRFADCLEAICRLIRFVVSVPGLVIGFLSKVRWSDVAKAVAEKKGRITQTGIAYACDMAIEWLFNYPLYGYVMWHYGLKKGFGIMVSLSFLVCYLQLIIYDKLKKDLFLVEGAKEWVASFEEYSGRNGFKKMISFFLRKGGTVAAFIVLSLWKDPFYTVAFCREGKFNGLDRRGWLIFIGSLIIGNVSWALTVFGGIELIKSLVAFVVGLF